MNLCCQWYSRIAIPQEKKNAWWEVIIDKYLGSVEFVLKAATIYNYHIENTVFSGVLYLLYL